MTIFYFQPEGPPPKVKGKVFHYEGHDEDGIAHFTQCDETRSKETEVVCVRRCRSGEAIPLGMRLGFVSRDEANGAHYLIEDLEEMRKRPIFERHQEDLSSIPFGVFGVN